MRSSGTPSGVPCRLVTNRLVAERRELEDRLVGLLSAQLGDPATRFSVLEVLAAFGAVLPGVYPGYLNDSTPSDGSVRERPSPTHRNRPIPATSRRRIRGPHSRRPPAVARPATTPKPCVFHRRRGRGPRCPAGAARRAAQRTTMWRTWARRRCCPQWSRVGPSARRLLQPRGRLAAAEIADPFQDPRADLHVVLQAEAGLEAGRGLIALPLRLADGPGARVADLLAGIAEQGDDTGKRRLPRAVPAVVDVVGAGGARLLCETGDEQREEPIASRGFQATPGGRGGAVGLPSRPRRPTFQSR